MEAKKLVLGLPNGSLFEPTITLFKRVGITIRVRGRNFMADIRGAGLFEKALIMRPQDIPEAIVDGVIDAGICGWDCVVEAGLEGKILRIVELPYGKNSKSPVQVVAFGKSERLIDEAGILVAAEYPRLAKRVFKEAGIRFSHGTTEAKVAYGRYDYGVGVVETGRSLADNGLNIVATLLVSPTVLVAKEKSLEIECFGQFLKGGLEAENYRLLKMDADSEAKEKIIRILPAIQAPTVSGLSDGKFAIETVVRREEVFNLIFRLQNLGARGILVQEINVLL